MDTKRSIFLQEVGSRLTTDMAAKGSFFHWNRSTETDESSRYAHLTREDGLTLCFEFDGYDNKKMIHISYSSGDLNKGAYVSVYDEKYQRVRYPSINVGMTKSAVQVATDIMKRLLDDAVRVHSLVLKTIAEEKKFVDTREVSTIRLADALGTVPKCDYNSKAYTYEIDPFVNTKSFAADGYGSFRVNSANSIELKLSSMSLETALKVAEALRTILVAKA